MEDIKHAIDLILKEFQMGNFQGFIKNLLTLRTLVLKKNPEDLDLGLVDLIMDENCFDWVVSVVDRTPTDFDWEAAKYIAEDLADTLKNLDK